MSGFDALPCAPHVGPFGRTPFLEVLHGHWGRADLLKTSTDDSAAMAELVDGTVTGVGHRDLVDYRSPLGPDGVKLLADLIGDRPFSIDSLPTEVATPLAAELRSRGRTVEVTEHDTAAVLTLPETFDDWLMALGKKERHETRRKRRRYEGMVGSPRIERFENSEERLAEFVALHRTSDGEKGGFMTDEMADYFGDVMGVPGWGIDALVTPEGRIAAAGFGFHGDDGYYLYNSCFDQQYRDASPGVVFIASLIEFAIDEGQMIFDFLKGDETYKYRLGATARPLFEVAG